MAKEESFHGRRILDHWFLPVDGELEEPYQDDCDGLWSPPKRRLGHAPPPPRPFGRFGGIVAVDADRLVQGLLNPYPPERTWKENQYAPEGARGICMNYC
jgi:hypothetical protein